MTRLDPVHPGEVLKHDFMEPFALSSTALAKALGVTPARINEIVRGRRGITAETALRLARFFRTDAQSWMNLQDRYELAVAERKAGDALAAIRPENRFMSTQSPWAESGFAFQILVEGGVFEEEEYYDRERPEQIATELRDLTEASSVDVHHIDPTVGAGSNGLAFLLHFLDVGTSVITWAVLVTAISPRIRSAMAYLRRLPQEGGHTVTVSLTAEALQVLVAAEVCARHGVDPSEITRLESVSHAIDPPEPRAELELLYAAHTVTVEAVGEDHYHHVWIYAVSPRGRVLAESEVRVPMPNATQWDWPKPMPGRLLETLET